MDLKKGLENLRRIINGRPVAILAAGPSIKELEEKISELSETDICYFGINSFFVQENHILKKINKHFSIIMEGPDEALPLIFDKVIQFLERNDDNLVASTFFASRFDLLGPDFNLEKFLEKYKKKLFFPEGTNKNADRTVPNSTHPLRFINGNILSWTIYLAIVGKASKIVLFGADGYTAKDKEEKYYRTEEYYNSDAYYMKGPDENQKILMENTNKGFNPIVPISLRNIYKAHGLKPIPILNCSTVSFYTPFPKVSYNDALAFLSGRKDAKEITDLRIPTASIVIPYSNKDSGLQMTFENISRQSYTNYELIPVQRKSNFLDTMKDALSSAKGKYIFYYPAGENYSDMDWINSCLELLENRPQISLVSGLSETNEIPWPKKRFIYYWLKRKTFFPANTLCIRKRVLEKCLFDNNSAKTESESWLNFNLNFNIQGYLPAFIPTTAENKQHTNENLESLNSYKRRIDDYKRKLIFKKTAHYFRDGDGNILPDKFYLILLLFYGFAKKIKAILPRSTHSYLSTFKHIARKIY